FGSNDDDWRTGRALSQHLSFFSSSVADCNGPYALPPQYDPKSYAHVFERRRPVRSRFLFSP
ncbi:hypothetical protein L249_5814, partial [Ophiocordyceps polyrhachis-furcata BCC 54312]